MSMKAKRSKALAVLPQWEPQPGIPASRDECRDLPRAVLPCTYVRCKWHLYLIESPDRQGRRWDGRPPATVVRAGWLESPPAPSCMLDFVEAVDRDEDYVVERIAAALGIRKSRAYTILKQGLKKLEDGGTTLSEFLEGEPRVRES